MRNAFPYPLPATALEEFRHPEDWHGLRHIVRHGDEVLAGNGYVAIRCERGRWLDADFREAPGQFLERFGKLPWHAFPRGCELWRPLADVASVLNERAAHGLWLRGRLAPSPVWRVGGVLVRLSMLQLVARLPRAEVNWTDHPESPLWFRFSGGHGLIARDARLTLESRAIFQPREDVLSGGLEKRKAAPGTLRLQHGPGWNWPPVDKTE
jgi:hypothetical protein